MPSQTNQNDPVLRVAIIAIAVTMGFAALSVGSDVFAPLLLALVTGVILAPVTDLLERAGFPVGLAALIVLSAGILAIAVIAVFIEPLIWRISDELPKIKWEIRAIIEDFRSLLRGLDEVNKEVEQALGADGENAGDAAAASVPNLASAVFLAPVVFAQLLIFLGTLFFFLMTRKGIYVWISRRIGSSAETDKIMGKFTAAEWLVSRYFLTISSINAALGAALAGILMLIGLPGALYWGLAATLLNFILYLGPAVMVAGLLIAGLVAYNGLISFLPAAIFLLLNMIESQFVTPTLIGRHMSVNPLLVFVSLVFWLWLWGPIGGIIAIPVLMIVLVMLDIFDTSETPGTD